MLVRIHYGQPKLECKKTYDIAVWMVAGLTDECSHSAFETLTVCFFSSLYSLFPVDRDLLQITNHAMSMKRQYHAAASNPKW